MTVLKEYYKLSNEVKIPKIGFGTWRIPGGKEAYSITMAALKQGYRHFDTAKKYENESSIGDAIRDSKIARKDIFISSKLPTEVMTYQGVMDEFDKTINNLKTDYIDLYLLHAPWSWKDSGNIHERENMEVWRAFEKLYEERKVRSIGVSKFGIIDLDNIVKEARIKPMVDQIRYFVGFSDEKLIKYCQENDILIEAYSPLAKGNIVEHPIVIEIANKYDVTPAQLAIRYCVQHGILPLPKAIDETHMRQNTELDFTISNDDIKRLEKLPDTDPDEELVR